MLTSFWFRK